MELEIAIKMGRFEDEGWRIRKDGSRFWANVVITPIYSSPGQLLGFSKVTRDLTERKYHEDQLKKARDELEIRVQARTEELSKAKVELEKALGTRDEFISIASHELKTPITSLKLQLQMSIRRLSNQNVDKSLDKTIADLSMSCLQVDRLTQLVNDLLDITRIQAGKLAYEFQPMQLSHTLNIIQDRFADQLRMAGSELALYIDEDIIGVWDELRIEQVFTNLISNSIKYAPRSPIVIFAKRQNSNIEISVEDYGPGIPYEHREKLFKRFERLGQSRSLSGLGLGLYITKQIIEAHGGSIEYRPGSKAGTKFIIVLPTTAETDKYENR
jgi:signal transduction histidine kinase